MERGWKPNIELAPACPRCGSSNTKFCYYNNYSLTQPRYFCKGCRRYWTKGGSLRNVPVGGGCRKSRRGKSTRAAADAARNSNPIQSSCSISAAPEPSTSIDLAAVYANFLNQPPRLPPENQIQTTLSELPGGIVIPGVEFPGFQSFHANQLSSHLPQENGFLECRSFPVRLSEAQLFGGNSTFFGGQFSTAEGNSIAGVNQIDGDVLPPLPGEEAAAMWPSSDMILQNQILPASEDEPTQQNSEDLNGNMMSPFTGFNLEAIFRS